MMICSLLPRSSIACRILSRNLSATTRSDQQWSPSGDPHKSFYYRDLLTTPASPAELKPKPASDEPLGFGKKFADHMIDIDWDMTTGWKRPQIRKNEPFLIDPAAKVFHYAVELFEGMKAYRGVDGAIRLFRPEMNMARMQRSAFRSALPDFDGDQLIDIIADLVRLDVDWVPSHEVGSLYIRPTMIGTEPEVMVSQSKQAKLYVITGPAGGYFGGAGQGVTLLADSRSVRAWPGGVGAFKMGCNYAPTIQVGTRAHAKDCQQVLWLSENEQWVTEAGAMNIFMFWKNDEGIDELITPSLSSGAILPGVTRQSLLDLARQWGQFKVSERDFTMAQLRRAVKEDRVYEMFGAGTAAVVSPVEGILYVNEGNEEKLIIPTLTSKADVMKRLHQEIVDIQLGVTERPGWTRIVA